MLTLSSAWPAATVYVLGRVEGSISDAKPVFCTSMRYSPGATLLNTNRPSWSVIACGGMAMGPLGGIAARIIGKTMTRAPATGALVPSAVTRPERRLVAAGAGVWLNDNAASSAASIIVRSLRETYVVSDFSTGGRKSLLTRIERLHRSNLNSVEMLAYGFAIHSRRSGARRL